MSAEQHHVSIDRDGTIATLTLQHGTRNLLNPAVMRELQQGFANLDEDPEVMAIILTGSGEAFCGGLDIEALKAGADPVEFATALVELLKLLPTLGTAVIGAVNGDALASGYSLACACDLVAAVPEARLGTFEASIGIWPVIAQVPPLQRTLPRHALQNIITGVPFTAEEAVRIGAINRVVPAGELAAAAHEMALAATASGSALASGRRSFYSFLDLPYPEALDAALDAFVRMIREGD